MIEFLKFIFSSGWIFLGFSFSFSFLLYLIIKAISVFKPFHIHKYYLDGNNVNKTDAINIANGLKKVENELKAPYPQSTATGPSSPSPVKETSLNDSVWDLIDKLF